MTEYEMALLNGERWAIEEAYWEELERLGWIPKTSSNSEDTKSSQQVAIESERMLCYLDDNDLPF